MTIREIISKSEILKSSFCKGLHALEGKHKRLVRTKTPGAVIGSANIDAAASESEPNANRWDYLIGVKKQRENAIFVEVHRAVTSEVDTVLRKLRWLDDFVNRELPGLRRGSFEEEYYWVATKGVHIPHRTSQYRRLALQGLHVVACLDL
jgi:hypothetical protein